ncbi:MAG TPA: cytochrome c3 family protein [Pyrinomonadaceae bacterium]|jgi:c(7)-type cytochrome triheme protein
MNDELTDKAAGAAERPDDRVNEPARRMRIWPLAVSLVLLLAATVLLGRHRLAETPGGPTEPGAAPPVQARDYSRFSHSTPNEHAQLMNRANCASCHRRRDNSAEPRFPAHKDCTGCHLSQFTTPDIPMCAICHTPEGLGEANPRLRKFPGLRSFKAEFDHAEHMQGLAAARPARGCVACHAPARRGVAQTIPAGLSAHQSCYECHTPGRRTDAGGDISSCGSCHGPGAYAQTSTAARAFRVGFSHAEHGQRQRLDCDSCHTVRGGGLAQARQVTSTLAVQHFASTRAQSCMTCHNGKRAFGDMDFNDCRRCHRGQTFRM